MSAAMTVVLHVLAVPLVLLDILIWVLTLGPLWMVLKKSKIPESWAKPAGIANINGGDLNPSAIWRSTDSVASGKLSTSPYPQTVKTLYELFSRAWDTYSAYPAQGIRPLVDYRTDAGFRFPARVFGPTVWRTYKEVGEKARAFGSALRALGLEPQPEGDFDTATGKFKILMYEDTSGDWMVAAQGAISQNIVVATAYATLGIEAVTHAVNEGEVTAIVCNRKMLPTLLKNKKDMPSLEAIIYTDYMCLPKECAEKVEASSEVKVFSFAEFLEMGAAKPAEPSPPTPDSVAVLMYTSGSTGNPKGVIVRHKHLLAMVAACKDQFSAIISECEETLICYLPLAHILELAAETFFYSMGSKLAYSDPKSLLGGPEKAYPKGSLEEFSPTLMAGVPKVWETIKKGAEAKIEKASPVKQFLFKLALKMKKIAVANGGYTPLFDKLVFKSFKNMIGGKMKFTLSGGGAISAEVQEWVRTAFGCPLVQGYGLTECCGGATIQNPADVALGIGGSVLSCLEITLHSEPEITDSNGKPYLATDTVHSDGAVCAGRGEVWIRGNNVTSGYYKMPEKTAEDFDKDGWFHTGDIGMMLPKGQIQIIDRKKNLVKLKGGEYVALEMINVTYNNCDIINTEAGGVCSYADHSLDKPVAFAQVKPAALEAMAAEAGVTGKEGKELCKDPKIMAAVKAKLDVVAKAAKLPALMHCIAIMPVVDPWTPENGCLTATSKLMSKAIYSAHAKELDILKPMASK